MTHKVGPKGQVVIPKAMRDELGLRPGDEVMFTLNDGSVGVAPAPKTWRSLRGILKGGPSLTEELEGEHRRELEREDRRGW